MDSLKRAQWLNGLQACGSNSAGNDLSRASVWLLSPQCNSVLQLGASTRCFCNSVLLGRALLARPSILGAPFACVIQHE
jgi:hypothetical protein